MTPPFSRKYVVICRGVDDLSISVISRQLMLSFWARKDSTSLPAATIVLASARGPAPRSRYARAPAASAAPQIMPH